MKRSNHPFSFIPAFTLVLLVVLATCRLSAVVPTAQAAPSPQATTQIIHGSAQNANGRGDQGQSGQPQNGQKRDAAAGNGSSGTGRAEGILVAEVLALLIVGRLLGEVMTRIGQPSLMGQLLAGIILGPSLFGWIWPEAQKFLFPVDQTQKGMIDGLSQIGILLLLLLTGMETDLKLVRKSGWAGVAVTVCGIAFPFACGFALGELGPARIFGQGDRMVTSLFLGTALSISSIKIVAMVVREMNFMRRNLGQLIVAAAIMEDTCGWVIIAITLGLAGASSGQAGAGINWIEIGKIIAGVALFLAFCFTVGRWFVFWAIRWVNDSFRSEFPVITMILVIMGLGAIITQLLGVRTVLGAFMAGVLIGESPILTDHIQQQLRGMITAFFMPIFFGLSGLSANLTIFADGRIAALTALLMLIASVGKFSGAFAGATLGGLAWREGIALGCAMNARGSTEVIVASIGLSMGALTPDLYTMVVAMAILTTMAMPPTLRAALRGLPMSKAEETRIAREAIDENGFLPRLERLLLVADESPIGRLAARIAGLIAGGQGMPVTILNLAAGQREAEPIAKWQDDDRNTDRSLGRVQEVEAKDAAKGQSRRESAAGLNDDRLAKEVKAGAEQSAAKVSADEAEASPEAVHLTARVLVGPPSAVIKDEARKGYDLMCVGLEAGLEDGGRFASKVTRLADGFSGPLLFLADCGGDVARLASGARLLVPVNGGPDARRAAEIACAIARGTGASVHALYVSRTGGSARTRAGEESVLKDISDLGERYGVRVSTQISPRADASDAIIMESRQNFALIVIGAASRPGDALFFGNTINDVLSASAVPVLLLAS